MQADLRHFSVASAHPSDQVEDARALFREYGLFLKATQSCGYHNHDRFEEEIAALPAPYTSRNGGLLVAYQQAEAIACFAYRAAYVDAASVCELKRLYVRPSHRGQGLARKLVEQALNLAKALGYKHVILDTDVATMAGAQKLYLSLGFAEYKPREGTIAFLDRSLA